MNQTSSPMDHELPAADDLIATIHDSWPASIPVFHAHQMKCVGCTMAGHETLSDALTIYNIQERVFMEDLHRAIQDSRR